MHEERQWTPQVCQAQKSNYALKLTHTNPHKHKCTATLLRTFPIHVGGILDRKASKQLRKKYKKPSQNLEQNSYAFFSINQFLSNLKLFSYSEVVCRMPYFGKNVSQKLSENGTQCSSINLTNYLQGKSYAKGLVQCIVFS